MQQLTWMVSNISDHCSIFLAQLFDIDLGFTAILLIALTALAASIGATSAPGTGIVILSTMLIAAGIPPVGVVLLLGVDRILDMIRTMVNVTRDLTACLFFNNRIEKYHYTITSKFYSCNYFESYFIFPIIVNCIICFNILVVHY